MSMLLSGLRAVAGAVQGPYAALVSKAATGAPVRGMSVRSTVLPLECWGIVLDVVCKSTPALARNALRIVRATCGTEFVDRLGHCGSDDHGHLTANHLGEF
jgi:hypothetical protein